MKYVSIGVLLLALAGCVSQQEQALKLAAMDDAACQSYGAKPGSDAYINCRTAKSTQHEQTAAQLRAAAIGSTTTCDTFGNTTSCY